MQEGNCQRPSIAGNESDEECKLVVTDNKIRILQISKLRIAKSPESSNEIRSLGNDFAHSHEGALIGEVFVAV